jgi:hypothetical protein
LQSIFLTVDKISMNLPYLSIEYVCYPLVNHAT